MSPVVNFNKISTTISELPNTVWCDLSRDKKLVYQYTIAVSRGLVENRLAEQVVGPINHSRWLTLATRVLVKYTRTANPSPSLITLVTFICQVYSPMWFRIKSRSKFTFGPSHLHHLLQLVQTQPEQVQQVVRKPIQNNAYFADPGIMVTSMLESEDKSI